MSKKEKRRSKSHFRSKVKTPQKSSVEPRLLRWTANNPQGFIDNNKTYRVYHGTQEHKIADIERKGLQSPEKVGAKWFMVTTNKKVAMEFAKGYEGKPVVIEYHIPANKLKEYLWKGYETTPQALAGGGDIQHGLRKPLPKEFIVKKEKGTGGRC